MSMVQCEMYEPFWAKHRDDWKPSTPDDVWGLREDREFEPPSLAHRKTLTRVRAEVTTARPIAVDTTERSSLNRRVQRSREVLEACGCVPTVYEAKPLPRAALAAIPPSLGGDTKPSDPHTAGKRLERANILTSSKMVYREWKIDSFERVLRVLWAFGSAEAYYAALAR